MELRWTLAMGVLSAVCVCAAADTSPSLSREVRLRVLVRDARGHAVRDLEQPDFSLSEDGTNAPVRAVKLVDSGPVHLGLIFDRMRGEPARLSKEAAIALLNLAPAATEFTVWQVDQKLTIVQPPTSDRKALKAAVEAATGKEAVEPPGAPPEEIAAVIRASARLLRESARRPEIAALIAVAQGQQHLAGNKAIVYFSGGLPLAGGADDSLRGVASEAAQAGTAIYTVDSSGLAITREEENARLMAVNSMISMARTTGYAQGQDTSKFAQNDRGVAVAQVGVGQMAPRNGPGDTYRPALADLAEKTGAFTIARGDDFRAPMRRLLDEVSCTWELTYTRPVAAADGAYHRLQVAVRRDKIKVRAPEGFFALPDAPGGAALAYEAPLLEMLPRAPVRDFPAAISTVQFRGKTPGTALVALLLEVPGDAIQFDEDPAASLYRARLSAVALVRGAAGEVVDRFGRDTPLQCPPEMLEATKRRRFLFEEDVELKPGDYTLETAIQDRQSGRVHVDKTPFTVTPPASGLSLSGLSVVRHIVATGADSKPDGAFRLAGRNIVPALDAVIDGGKAATATLFFRLYSGPAPQLAFEIVKDGKPVVHKPLQAAPSSQDPGAQVIALDISAWPAGAYGVRITANEGGATATAEATLTVRGGAAPAAATAEEEDVNVDIRPAATLPTAPPTAEQQAVLDHARAAALRYSEHLPNFICTQVTRRLLDPIGKDQWTTLDESSQLVSYYDGKEHYSTLTTRNRSAESDRYPPAMTSTGEFGTLLKTIFGPESAAHFSWVRADSIRGRSVQVFAYQVDAAHSEYRISHRVGGVPKSIVSPYSGLVFIDPDSAAVLRLTLQSETLPADFPIHQLSMSLDYGDMAVGGQVYILPLSFTLDLRLHKRTLVRNEVGFRSYQRFTAESRLITK
ncbi:MAG TPA: VWA domain-containing protein [Bryobacteraceae bacterium]